MVYKWKAWFSVITTVVNVGILFFLRSLIETFEVSADRKGHSSRLVLYPLLFIISVVIVSLEVNDTAERMAQCF